MKSIDLHRNRSRQGCFRKLLLATALSFPLPLFAQMNMSMKASAGATAMSVPMNPYFSAISDPVPKGMTMVMLLPDYQSAATGPNFATAMVMAEYGITSRWTAGLMAEGEKVAGNRAAYGGWRANTYFHLFRDERWLNVTLYGEYEHLNGAALYKMEVAGFGPEDLTEPLSEARRTHAYTFEQRAIVYHDFGRTNATFNFIRETLLEAPRGNDYGYALGVFENPQSDAMSADVWQTGFTAQHLGYGIEMIGSLGDQHRFGVSRGDQQHYIGTLLTYDLTSHWSVRVEPAIGLTHVSDPFILRTGFVYSFGGAHKMGGM